MDRGTQCSLITISAFFPKGLMRPTLSIYKIHDRVLNSGTPECEVAVLITRRDFGEAGFGLHVILCTCVSTCTSAELLFLAMHNTTQYQHHSSSKEGNSQNGLQSSTLICKCWHLLYHKIKYYMHVCIYIKRWHTIKKLLFSTT